MILLKFDNLGGCGYLGVTEANVLVRSDQERFKLIEKELETVNLT